MQPQELLPRRRPGHAQQAHDISALQPALRRRLLRQPNAAAVMPSAVAALYATCTGYGCSGANKISAESAASALPASIRANGARWPLSAPAASRTARSRADMVLVFICVSPFACWGQDTIVYLACQVLFIETRIIISVCMSFAISCCILAAAGIYYPQETTE